MTNDDPPPFVAEACLHMERAAKALGIDTSLTLKSVTTLEEILVALKSEGDSRALSGGEYLAGIYLGEILRLTGGGSWMEGCIVRVGDMEVSPVEKVRQFVRSPASDGLVFYSQVVSAAAKNATK